MTTAAMLLTPTIGYKSNAPTYEFTVEKSSSPPQSPLSHEEEEKNTVSSSTYTNVRPEPKINDEMQSESMEQSSVFLVDSTQSPQGNQQDQQQTTVVTVHSRPTSKSQNFIESQIHKGEISNNANIGNHSYSKHNKQDDNRRSGHSVVYTEVLKTNENKFTAKTQHDDNQSTTSKRSKRSSSKKKQKIVISNKQLELLEKQRTETKGITKATSDSNIFYSAPSPTSPVLQNANIIEYEWDISNSVMKKHEFVPKATSEIIIDPVSPNSPFESMSLDGDRMDQVKRRLEPPTAKGIQRHKQQHNDDKFTFSQSPLLSQNIFFQPDQKSYNTQSTSVMDQREQQPLHNTVKQHQNAEKINIDMKKTEGHSEESSTQRPVENDLQIDTTLLLKLAKPSKAQDNDDDKDGDTKDEKSARDKTDSLHLNSKGRRPPPVAPKPTKKKQKPTPEVEALYAVVIKKKDRKQKPPMPTDSSSNTGDVTIDEPGYIDLSQKNTSNSIEQKIVDEPDYTTLGDIATPENRTLVVGVSADPVYDAVDIKENIGQNNKENHEAGDPFDITMILSDSDGFEEEVVYAHVDTLGKGTKSTTKKLDLTYMTADPYTTTPEHFTIDQEGNEDLDSPYSLVKPTITENSPYLKVRSLDGLSSVNDDTRSSLDVKFPDHDQHKIASNINSYEDDNDIYSSIGNSIPAQTEVLTVPNHYMYHSNTPLKGPATSKSISHSPSPTKTDISFNFGGHLEDDGKSIQSDDTSVFPYGQQPEKEKKSNARSFSKFFHDITLRHKDDVNQRNDGHHDDDDNVHLQNSQHDNIQDEFPQSIGYPKLMSNSNIISYHQHKTDDSSLKPRLFIITIEPANPITTTTYATNPSPPPSPNIPSYPKPYKDRVQEDVTKDRKRGNFFRNIISRRQQHNGNDNVVHRDIRNKSHEKESRFRRIRSAYGSIFNPNNSGSNQKNLKPQGRNERTNKTTSGVDLYSEKREEYFRKNIVGDDIKVYDC